MYLKFITWFSDEVASSFPLAVSFTLEDGGREITSWQLQPLTDSSTWHLTTAKKTTPISCSRALKAKMIRCYSWSHANQAKVIHVEGLTSCKKQPEMFLCFDESWYQPPLKLFPSANPALSCKINIKIGACGCGVCVGGGVAWGQLVECMLHCLD